MQRQIAHPAVLAAHAQRSLFGVEILDV